jgi:hypothetical protein
MYTQPDLAYTFIYPPLSLSLSLPLTLCIACRAALGVVLTFTPPAFPFRSVFFSLSLSLSSDSFDSFTHLDSAAVPRREE